MTRTRLLLLATFGWLLTYPSAFAHNDNAGEGQFNRPGGIAADASGNVYVTTRLNHRIPVVAPTEQPRVFSFTLVDAGTGKDVQLLQEGDVLNLVQLPAQLSIRANTDPAEVGSVVFGLNDQPNLRVENFAPYALAGNYPNDRYLPYALQFGAYTLTATPCQVNGQGAKGLALTVHFQVVRPKVASFTLINAATGGEIKSLKEDEVLDLATLPARLTVRANTEPEEVGSVVFDLNGKAAIRVENFVPYALASNQPDTGLTFLSQFGSLGSGEGEFIDPTDVAVDGGGHVYVVNHNNHRIQKFDSSGHFLLQFGSRNYSGCSLNS